MRGGRAGGTRVVLTALLARPVVIASSVLHSNRFIYKNRQEEMLKRFGARLLATTTRPAVLLESSSAVVASLAVTPFAMNQYLLGCRATGEAAIIDAGDDDPERWLDIASKLGLKIRHVLLTHAHIDHVAGLASTKEMLPKVPIYLHPDDWLVRAPDLSQQHLSPNSPTLVHRRILLCRSSSRRRSKAQLLGSLSLHRRLQIRSSTMDKWCTSGHWR